MVKRFSKRIVLLGMLLSCVILLFTGGCEKILEALKGIEAIEWLYVPIYPQETGMWCWAASGEMVMHYLGKDVDQCTQANNRFGRTDCCNIDLCPSPTEPTCNVTGGHPCACGGWPEFDKYGFNFKTTTNAALSWNTLKNQIAKRPFCVTWAWPGGGGHMMVARAYMTKNGKNYVGINDPWPPCTGDFYWVTYDFYDAQPGHHTHWNDYYDVIPK